MAQRKTSKPAAAADARATREVQTGLKELDLQLRKVRKAMVKIAGPTWSFSPGPPTKRKKH